MQNLDNTQTDVAVVGAGPAGLSFALCLAKSGLKITLIDLLALEDIQQPMMDGRDIAMNHMSKKILTDLGVWQRFQPQDVHLLKEAKVMDGASPYALHLTRCTFSVMIKKMLRLVIWWPIIKFA